MATVGNTMCTSLRCKEDTCGPRVLGFKSQNQDTKITESEIKHFVGRIWKHFGART